MKPSTPAHPTSAAPVWHEDATRATRGDVDLGRGLVQFAGKPNQFAIAETVLHVPMADILRIAAGYLVESAKRGGGLPATADDILAAARELRRVDGGGQ